VRKEDINKINNYTRRKTEMKEEESLSEKRLVYYNPMTDEAYEYCKVKDIEFHTQNVQRRLKEEFSKDINKPIGGWAKEFLDFIDKIFLEEYGKDIVEEKN